MCLLNRDVVVWVCLCMHGCVCELVHLSNVAAFPNVNIDVCRRSERLEHVR